MIGGRWAILCLSLVGGVAALAACGGGGGRALPSLTNATAAGPAANGSARVTLKVPSLASLQALRGPAWISPAAQSVVIGVSSASGSSNTAGAAPVKHAYDISPASPVCTPAPNGRICAFTIPAPVGNDVFTVDLYDGPVPSSAPLPGATSYGTPAPVPNHLGTTSVVSQIAANTLNTLTFTVGGLPATLVLTPATIVFTPYPYVGGGGTPGPTPPPTSPPILTTNVYVSAQDADGVTIVGPDQYGSGINVQVYGLSSPSPNGTPAVTIVGASNPTQVTLGSPAQGQPLQLQYNTTLPFTTPVSLVATSNGIASATALVVNNVTLPPASCTPQPDPTSLAVNFLNLDPTNYRTAAGYSYNGLFHVPMSIGSPFPTAPPGSGSPPPTVGITIDTGSVGLAVSTDLFYVMMGLKAPPPPTGSNPTPIPFPSPLPPGVVGPTGQGQITYTSDGLMEIGQFFTVPLNIFTNFNSTSPVAVTVPTQILVVTNQGCNLNFLNGRTCTPNPVAYGVQNMGIGFYPLDIATVYSPVANPFLQLAQELYGQIHRRYVINNSGMFFGGTASDLAGFQWIKLQQDRNNLGDWVQPPMCVSYPGQTPVTYTCGQMLVDTGLPSMIMNIPASQQISNLPGYLTSNKPVNVIAPGPGASPPALNWTFTSPGVAPSPFTPPVYPAAVPNGITVGNGTAGQAFINTSQRIIYAFDYAYDADCGAVGFRPASPAPPPIP